MSLSLHACILSVLFAQPRENWEQYYKSRKEYFAKLFNDFQIKMANPHNFSSQIQWADVVYIHGGDETLLAYWLNQYDLKHLFSEKVIIGSSAGAEYLSKNFNTPDWREIKSGKGFVEANVIVHYGSEYGVEDPRGPVDWGRMKDDLKGYDPNTKVYCIGEGDFVVFEK